MLADFSAKSGQRIYRRAAGCQAVYKTAHGRREAISLAGRNVHPELLQSL